MPDDFSLFSLIKWSPLDLLIPIVIIQRIAELRLAKRNERALLKEGAVEAGANHYGAIVALHTLWFIGMIAEIVVLSRPINPFWPVLLLIVILAQWLRYSAIRSLGRFWNTKILVLPGARVVARGPYRFLKHPNYIAVMIELLVLPLIFSCYVTAITASILNVAILMIRIRAEEKALRELGKGYDKVGKVFTGGR
ncbi:MAG: isoprenylcysteine carboxyl methyltransferase [Chlorobi bacterium]|nr:isoprenylcysteine carboxyl methyltransferase [Chlorobiota bacterium]